MNNIDRELALESEAVMLSVAKLQEKIDKQGFVEATSTGKAKLKDIIESVASEIESWITETEKKCKRKPPAYSHIKGVDAIQLAYITSKQLVNSLMLSEALQTEACDIIGNIVCKKVEYDAFIAMNPESDKKLQYKLKEAETERDRDFAINSEMERQGFSGLDWPKEDKVAVGFTLIQCAIAATNIVQVKVVRSGKVSKSLLVPTKDTKAWLADAALRDALIMPFHYPMVVPPQPWTNIYDGGYLDKSHHGLEFVRTRRKAPLRSLEAVDLSEVMSGVNTIQSTPWRVNTKVLRVLAALADSMEPVAGLSVPHAPKLPEPVVPSGLDSKGFSEWVEQGHNKAIYSSWKLKSRNARKEAAKSNSKRLVIEQQLALANKFKDEAAIYFPHTLDFRGRIYPSAGLGSMNPQGDDRGKALLEFSEGKALGESGGYWLCVHVANCFGKDKEALDHRVLWTMANVDQIKACAENPLTETWWYNAEKPFQFLAACFDVLGFLTYGDAYVSHLPIAQDGSCSGLQHFAAMLLDEDTASAVNVIQTGSEPNDVYNVVAEAVMSRLQEDVKSEPLADTWLPVVCRDLIKQPVMTTPYGVTKRGMTKQLENALVKLVDKEKVAPLSSEIDVAEACRYLTEVTYDSIGSKVRSAREAMDWLKLCAQIAAKEEGSAVHWTTPSGFLAIQHYTKAQGKRLQLRFRGQRVDIQLAVTGNKLNNSKQSAGMAPNFVHSLDASHLNSTVLLAALNGVENFAMIHDSFGTHAADTETMWACTRYAFEKQYSGNVLLDFYEELREQLSPKTFAKIPPPPAQGDLEICQVNTSEFFFN